MSTSHVMSDVALSLMFKEDELTRINERIRRKVTEMEALRRELQDLDSARDSVIKSVADLTDMLSQEKLMANYKPISIRV